MKKRICAQMIIPLLLLCGCGQAGLDTEAAVDAARENLNVEAGLQAIVKADYGDRVYEFELSYENGVLTVVSPDTIAGVTARVTDEGENILEFDGVMLDMGTFDETGLTPVSAIPAMLRAIQNGYVSETGSEMRGDTEYLTAVFKMIGTMEEETITHRVWFERETERLAYGEIEAGGRTMVYLEFR